MKVGHLSRRRREASLNTGSLNLDGQVSGGDVPGGVGFDGLGSGAWARVPLATGVRRRM